MQHIRIPLLAHPKLFEYEISYQVTYLRVNTISYEIQDFTLTNLLIKLTSPVSIFFNIQIERVLKTIFSMVLSLNRQNFFSSLPYAKHKYFHNFLQIH